MVMKVNLTEAKELAIFYMGLGLLPMLHGTFGLGKSSIAREIADEFNLLLIDMRLSQCDPTDLNGFPKERNGRSYYAPPENIPLAGDPLPIKTPGRPAIKKGDKLPTGAIAPANVPAVEPVYYDGWLLFMDEINSADEDMQAASYKVTLDRKIGDKDVHPQCAMIAAGNLETDGAIVNQMSSALVTRLVHIVIDNQLEVFLKWASQIKMDSRITSFLNWKPSYLHHIPENNDDPTYACNRTWEFADRVFKNKDTSDKLFLPALAGCITQGMAMELDTHIKVFATLPKYADIISQPLYTTIPEEPGTMWALIGFVADNAKKADMPQLMQFISRLPKEHQVVLMLDMGRKHPEVMKTSEVTKWCSVNANVVF
jgi:hypothetical protein